MANRASMLLVGASAWLTTFWVVLNSVELLMMMGSSDTSHLGGPLRYAVGVVAYFVATYVSHVFVHGRYAIGSWVVGCGTFVLVWSVHFNVVLALGLSIGHIAAGSAIAVLVAFLVGWWFRRLQRLRNAGAPFDPVRL